tara:strand:+ start:221 stop:976 length:756 start_codon:yes stop_codon:yes gene_type:complete
MDKSAFKIISHQVAKKKGLKRYFTGKPCIRQHISERGVAGRNCIECAKIHEKKYSKSKKGREKKLIKQKKYYANNITEIRIIDNIRSKTPKHKERTKKYNQRLYVQKKRKNYNIKYRKNNLEKLLIKDRIYSKNVRRKNPIHKIKENLRRRMLLALKAQNAKKTTSLNKLLGCTIPKFKKHIADQFYPHPKFTLIMTWENHGLKTWHIDHIKPLKLFDLTKIKEQKKAFHYKNCSPKWAKENLSKGARFIG